MVKYSPKTGGNNRTKFCTFCKKNTHFTSECRRNKQKKPYNNNSANAVYSDNTDYSNLNIDLNNIDEVAECRNNDVIVDYRGNFIGETD